MAEKFAANLEPPSPRLVNNWVSITGVMLTLSSFFATACLIAIDFFRGFPNPYMGILTYLVAPAFLLGGLLLISIGVLIERRRRRRAQPGEIPLYPRIDFNIPHHRQTFTAVTSVTFVFLLFTALGSYRTYEFTESVTFCGEVCHNVMEPEFTAYQDSPHARVPCVQCHIGSGATWFVKSKLSGVYQVYATVTKKYPRPIPTPVEELRPVEETCEQCHWPRLFHGAVERVFHRYLSDEQNSPWTIRMLVNVGGGDPSSGPVGGIHWRHMDGRKKIQYIAADDSRQIIPWVRVTDARGNVTEYESKENPLQPQQISTAEPRVMDCVDCHNRPTHIFNSPAHAVDLAISTGRIDRAIPYIKREAVAVLTKPYQTSEEALGSISQTLVAYYKSNPTPWTRGNPQRLSQAISEIQKIYKENFFPSMKVSWRVYPDNRGHKAFPGCFRCHDGNHVSAKGETLARDCDSCHTIISQGADQPVGAINAEGLEFTHPVDIQGVWRETACGVCHQG